MGTNTTYLLTGLSLGTVLGIAAHRFSRSRKGRHLKEKMRCTMHDFGDKAGEWYGAAKEKVKDAGAKVAEKTREAAEKVAEKGEEVVQKAEELKSGPRPFAARP